MKKPSYTVAPNMITKKGSQGQSHHKSVYNSIWEYYKEMIAKSNSNLQYLVYLKFFDGELYKQIL
jgi:hypothetical protein